MLDCSKVIAWLGCPNKPHHTLRAAYSHGRPRRRRDRMKRREFITLLGGGVAACCVGAASQRRLSGSHFLPWRSTIRPKLRSRLLAAFSLQASIPCLVFRAFRTSGGIPLLSTEKRIYATAGVIGKVSLICWSNVRVSCKWSQCVSHRSFDRNRVSCWLTRFQLPDKQSAVVESVMN